MSTVAIKRSPDIAEGIKGALDLLGDLNEILRNKYVAVKPNDTWAMSGSIHIDLTPILP